MDKNDQQRTNKTRYNPGSGVKKSVKRSSKHENELKAESPKPKAVPEIQLKAERQKAKAVPEINKSDIENGGALNEVNPTFEINELKAESPKPKAISEVNKSDIENPKSEITQMEVHHHPQLDHTPKPFKEYLLESFMIFIAVMMGFIAENIRETIDNNEHVKQLTSQLVQDLKADTTTLNGIYAADKQILKNNDTLFNLLQQPIAKADTKRSTKILLPIHTIMWPFHPLGEELVEP